MKILVISPFFLVYCDQIYNIFLTPIRKLNGLMSVWQEIKFPKFNEYYVTLKLT